MATLRVDGAELVLELTTFEKMEGMHGTIREPLRAVTRVRAVDDPWAELRGIRAPGTGIPGVVAVGTRRGADIKDFAALHGKGPAVVVDLEGATFRRLLATVDDAPAVAAAIAARCPGVGRGPARRVRLNVAHGRVPAVALDGTYEPSTWDWVRDQVELYEQSGGTEGLTLWDTGMPVVVLTMQGHKSGKVRKAPVMRVEHDGLYAIIASKGGDPHHPSWYFNLVAHPDEVRLQDGPSVMDVTVSELEGADRDTWWERAVAAYPPYAEYQANTDRRIPVLLATPRS